jgi:hypothetical protein
MSTPWDTPFCSICTEFRSLCPPQEVLTHLPISTNLFRRCKGYRWPLLLQCLYEYTWRTNCWPEGSTFVLKYFWPEGPTFDLKLRLLSWNTFDPKDHLLTWRTDFCPEACFTWRSNFWPEGPTFVQKFILPEGPTFDLKVQFFSWSTFDLKAWLYLKGWLLELG